MDNSEIAQCNITDDEQSELLELNTEYQNLVLSLGELQVKEITLKKELKLVKETKNNYKETLTQFKQKEKMFFGFTPNAHSLNILIHGIKDPVISPPSHVFYFTTKSLDKLMKQHGFRRVFNFTIGFSTNSFFRKSKFQPTWKIEQEDIAQSNNSEKDGAFTRSRLVESVESRGTCVDSLSFNSATASIKSLSVISVNGEEEYFSPTGTGLRFKTFSNLSEIFVIK